MSLSISKKNRKPSNQAAAAAAIRAELKTRFPGVKFSVTSEGFSMGSAVDIRWTDGPTNKQVSDITGKYQYGHFDGMNDMYENSNCRNDIPQAKYVSTHRKYSPVAIDKAISAARAKYGFRHDCTAEDYLHGRLDSIPAVGNAAGDYNWSVQSVLYRTLSDMSF